MELRIEKDEGDTLKVTEGEIVYENVSFSYPGREKKVIDGLNLTIAGGSHVALLGPSGIGKSTVVNVLFREGELSNGVVKVDGKDITKVSKES
jgi:ABC-type multidrug transport system fused ATPase/permease subunit